MLGIVLYLVVIVGGFFVLWVRPQRRQRAAQAAFVASLEVGDEVITNAGIYGSVAALDDRTAQLEIAPNVVVKIARGAIITRTSEPEPQPDAS